MRTLSKEEKEFCTKIINFEGFQKNYFHFLIEDKLLGAKFTVFKTARKASLSLPFYTVKPWNSKKPHWERLEELLLLAFTALTLIKLLEDNGYLMTYQLEVNQDEWSLGDKESEGPTYEITDSKIIDLLISYSKKQIVITDEFKLYCNRNFRAKDEYRFRRQLTITTIAVSISAITLSTNLYFNITRTVKATPTNLNHIDSSTSKTNFLKSDTISIHK